MRVYVATAYANKYAAVDAASILRGAGHTITSRWHADGLSRDEAAAVEGDWDASARAAAGCYWDVARADALVMLHVPGMRGAYCELGYALALDRHVVVVGEWRRGPLMLRVPQTHWAPDVEAAAWYLSQRGGDSW